MKPINELSDLPFGIKLQAVRRARGYTLARLSEKTGMSEHTLQSYEVGRSNPSLFALEIICTALDIDSSLILDF